MLLRAVGWGMIGGGFGGLFNLPWFIQFREYDPAYALNYLMRPFVGALLGAMLAMSSAGSLTRALRNLFVAILVLDFALALFKPTNPAADKSSYYAIKASGGAEALMMVETDRPDLILLDLMMPEMDGYEFIRLHRRERETPVILLTAREWTQQYEWNAHYAIALKAGLDPQVALDPGDGVDDDVRHCWPPFSASTTRSRSRPRPPRSA